MHQRVRRLVFFVGAASLVTGGLMMAACSTDNGSSSGTSGVPGFDGSKPDSRVDTDTGPAGDSGGGEAGGDADCSKAPKLRDNTNGFYCAFYRSAPDGGADGGTTSNCDNNQICCNTGAKYPDGGFAPSFCADQAAAGNKGADTQCAADAVNKGSLWEAGTGSAWECNDKVACTGTQVCCMISSSAGTVNVGNDKSFPSECNAKLAFKQNGTRCKAGPSCASNEIKLCSLSDKNCGAGSTCTPFAGFFRDLGYCFP